MIEKQFLLVCYQLFIRSRHNSIFSLLPFSILHRRQCLKAADFDEFDGVYADLDDENYGPINYKQASIYQYMKFKKNNQK